MAHEVLIGVSGGVAAFKTAGLVSALVQQGHGVRIAGPGNIPGVRVAERRLRLAVGLPINDSQLIRPLDEPASAPIRFDWQITAHQSLVSRPELRKQQLAISKLYFLTQNESDDSIARQKQQRSKDSNNPQQSAREQRQTKIARLQAEIRKMSIDYAKRPKTITLTASTRKAVEASYLASWVQKIEHTGNLNYPQEARLKNLTGRLRMSVRLNANGDVLDMQITSSSGNKVLDEAARQILRMAQPFDPFSEELKDRADQIVIIRTWDFKSNRFKTKSGVS